jgi:hypothetical protein
MDFFEKIENGCLWFIDTRFGRKVLNILYDTAVLILYVGAIALLHKVLDMWIGKDAKLLEILPISYIIDVGHILAIGLFFLEIVKEIVNAIREIIWIKSEA